MQSGVPLSPKSKALSFSVFVVAVGLIAFVLFARSARRSSKVPQCHFNLMQLELCKHDWASEKHKTDNDTPTWEDLREYFPEMGWTNIPVCPRGGTYTIGRVGEKPKCSIGGGYDHSLL